MLEHYQKLAEGAGGDTSADQAGAADGGAAGAGQPGKARAHAVGAKGQQQRPRTAADLANELQYSLQQAEEKALREKRAAREAAERQRRQAARGGRGGEGGEGGEGGKAPLLRQHSGDGYEEAVKEVLNRANERHPLADSPALGQPGERRGTWVAHAASQPTGSSGSAGDASAADDGVRMLVGVVSACCTEAAAQRRAAIRETWARDVLQVRAAAATYCGQPGLLALPVPIFCSTPHPPSACLKAHCCLPALCAHPTPACLRCTLLPSLTLRTPTPRLPPMHTCTAASLPNHTVSGHRPALLPCAAAQRRGTGLLAARHPGVYWMPRGGSHLTERRVCGRGRRRLPQPPARLRCWGALRSAAACAVAAAAAPLAPSWLHPPARHPAHCSTHPTPVQAELAAHNDSVVLRGADTYRALPNKTLRLLRYAVAHPAGAPRVQGAAGQGRLQAWQALACARQRQPTPAQAFCVPQPRRAAANQHTSRHVPAACPSLPRPPGYTHVLKVDDDVYLRIGRVLRALRSPPGADLAAPPSPRALPATHQQLQAEMARQPGSVLHTDGIQVRFQWGRGTEGSDGAAGVPAASTRTVCLCRSRVRSRHRQTACIPTSPQLYNATLLVARAGDTAGACPRSRPGGWRGAVRRQPVAASVPHPARIRPRDRLTRTAHLPPRTARKTLDDAEGEYVSLADLSAAAAAAAAARERLRAAGAAGAAREEERPSSDGGAGSGSGSTEGGSSPGGPAAVHPPRMAGVYLGCMENKVRQRRGWPADCPQGPACAPARGPSHAHRHCTFRIPHPPPPWLFQAGRVLPHPRPRQQVVRARGGCACRRPPGRAGRGTAYRLLPTHCCLPPPRTTPLPTARLSRQVCAL